MNAQAQQPRAEPQHPTFCAIPSPSTVYAAPSTRAEFDRLALPEIVHDWRVDSVTTLLEDDGRTWERRCHSKVLGDHSPGSLTVIFQWFDQRPAKANAQGGAA